MFEIAGAEYAIKKLPFNNKLLGCVSWMLSLKQDLELENQVLGVAAELSQVITLEQKSALRGVYGLLYLPASFSYHQHH